MRISVIVPVVALIRDFEQNPIESCTMLSFFLFKKQKKLPSILFAKIIIRTYIVADIYTKYNKNVENRPVRKWLKIK